MTVSAELVARLRLMVAEPTLETYTDDALKAIIARYPTLDEFGQEPWLYAWWDIMPSQRQENPFWTPTYDLHAAAGDVWDAKAAAVAGSYDFKDANSTFSRSQIYEQYMAQARSHRSRRKPTSVAQRTWPPTNASMTWIGNLPEPRDA